MDYEELRDSIIADLKKAEKHLSLMEEGSDKFMKAEELDQVASDLRSELSSFQTLAYNGEAPPDLRGSKLEQLKDWLSRYNQSPVDLVLSDMPKSKKNKDISIDTSVLDKYASYCQKAIDYMETFSDVYSSFMDEVEPALRKAKTILEERRYRMQHSEFGLADDGSEEVMDIEVESITPEKTINKVENLLKPFAKFIKKVEEKKKAIKSLVDRLNEIGTVETFEGRLSRKSNVKMLFKLLAELRGKIKLHPYIVGLFADKYNEIFNKALNYVPTNVAARLSNQSIQQERSKKEAKNTYLVIKLANKFSYKYC